MVQKVSFIKELSEVTHATKKQITEEHWHVEGVLRKRSNQKLKFDISPLIKFNTDDYGKIGHFDSKSDKIVFDFKSLFFIVSGVGFLKYLF